METLVEIINYLFVWLLCLTVLSGIPYIIGKQNGIWEEQERRKKSR